MSDGVQLLNQNILWPVVLIVLLLLTVFVWKEWEQRNGKRFWVKSVLALMSVASLAMIILRPATFQEETKGKAIILTKGYRTAQLDSLQSIYKRIPMENYSPGKTLSILEEADSLFLLGQGLETYDLWQLDDATVSFLGAGPLMGWTKISHETNILLGEQFSLFAQYAQPTEGHWAILADNGGNPLDSVVFGKAEQQTMRLSATTKASGTFVYQLWEKDGDGKVLSKEPIPVHVEKGTSLRILMVNTFPTFETKYLKNFLAENGHEVQVRTQLTKGKYKFEYFNGASEAVYGFTMDQLEKYDLLILDTDSYTGLSNASKRAIEASARVNGLGIFVQPNERMFRLSKNRFPLGFERDGRTEISLGQAGETLATYPYQFETGVRQQPIAINSTIIAGYVPMEKGKLGSTVLQNTYQLVLEGDDEIYASIWTQILNGIAKPQESEMAFEALIPIPKVDEPFLFEIRTLEENPQLENSDGSPIALLQDASLPSKWSGTQYPRKIGWNQVRSGKDSTVVFSYYVFDKDRWSSVATAHTIQANKRKFGTDNRFRGKSASSNGSLQPISPLWFYVLLLLCLGWLWLEPKLFP